MSTPPHASVGWQSLLRSAPQGCLHYLPSTRTRPCPYRVQVQAVLEYLYPVRAGPATRIESIMIKFYSTAVGRGHCRQGRLSVYVGMRLGRPARWATPPVVLPRLPTPVRGRGSPRGFEHNRSRDKRQRSLGCGAPSTDDLYRLCIDRLFCLHVQGVTIQFLAVQASEPSFSAYLELNAPSTPPHRLCCFFSLFVLIHVRGPGTSSAKAWNK